MRKPIQTRRVRTRYVSEPRSYVFEQFAILHVNVVKMHTAYIHIHTSQQQSAKIYIETLYLDTLAFVVLSEKELHRDRKRYDAMMLAVVNIIYVRQIQRVRV